MAQYHNATELVGRLVRGLDWVLCVLRGSTKLNFAILYEHLVYTLPPRRASRLQAECAKVFAELSHDLAKLLADQPLAGWFRGAR